MNSDDDDAAGEYASPACFLHEVDPAYSGLLPVVDGKDWQSVKRWRKSERERLISARLMLSAAVRQEHANGIVAALSELIGNPSGRIIALYWPFRGEPDLRSWMMSLHNRGGCCSLPVVVGRNEPLVFRPWRPGTRLERGVWNIPVPADGPEVVPDVVIAPIVGFDEENYRLGYGGGYYDRTLAAIPARPRVIGLGYAQAAIETIHPQPHDIPMDVIVTERGTVEQPEGHGR